MPFTVTAYIPSIKPGIYSAICTDVEEKAPASDPTNLFRVWHFQLTDGSLRTIDGTSSLSMGTRAKGRKWAAALIGHDPVDGEEVAPEGKTCTVVVAINDKGYEFVENVAPASPIAPPTSGGTPATVTSEKPFDEGDLPF
jgi:hypothetical protein